VSGFPRTVRAGGGAQSSRRQPENGGSIAPEDPGGKVDRMTTANPETIFEAIITTVDAEPRPRAEILDLVTRRTGASRGAISAELSRLVRAGILLRPSRGRYRFNTALIEHAER